MSGIHEELANKHGLVGFDNVLPEPRTAFKFRRIGSGRGIIHRGPRPSKSNSFFDTKFEQLAIGSSSWFNATEFFCEAIGPHLR